MTVTAVMGSQWGDEGKGKVVDVLSESADYVARFNGGNNAGHTVINSYGTFKIHLVPSGVFAPNAVALIGGGVVVDPAVLLEEMDTLVNSGIRLEGRFWVSPRAHLILPYHKVLDRLYESAKGSGATGTTGRGIGPVYADKVSYNGIRFSDFARRDVLVDRLRLQVALKNRIIQALGGEPLDCDEILESYSAYYTRLQPFIRELFPLIQQGLAADRNFLLEQAMGSFLDTDWGTYPFVTASSTLPSAATAGLGIPSGRIDRIVSVTKAYTTRVGAGPLPTEIHDTESPVYKQFAETAATTGRTRRVGWLDLELVRTSAALSGATELCLTKLDVLSGIPDLQVCTGYRQGDQALGYMDVDSYGLSQVEPVYETLKGWEADLTGIRRFKGLPPEARAYISLIEEVTRVPIKWISVGPEREAIIRR